MNVNRYKLGRALRVAGIAMGSAGAGMLNPYVAAFGAIMAVVGTATLRGNKKQLDTLNDEIAKTLENSDVPPEHRDIEHWKKIIENYYGIKPPKKPGKRP